MQMKSAQETIPHALECLKETHQVHSQCWQRRGAMELIRCWWENKTRQPLRKALRQFLLKTQMVHPEILFLIFTQEK